MLSSDAQINIYKLTCEVSLMYFFANDLKTVWFPLTRMPNPEFLSSSCLVKIFKKNDINASHFIDPISLRSWMYYYIQIVLRENCIEWIFQLNLAPWNGNTVWQLDILLLLGDFQWVGIVVLSWRTFRFLHVNICFWLTYALWRECVYLNSLKIFADTLMIFVFLTMVPYNF